jgi:hypothetical protein
MKPSILHKTQIVKIKIKNGTLDQFNKINFNIIRMIEHKVNIDDFQVIDFQSTFEYIFNRINIDKVNTSVTFIKDIDKLDRKTHQKQDHHQRYDLN